MSLGPDQEREALALDALLGDGDERAQARARLERGGAAAELRALRSGLVRSAEVLRASTGVAGKREARFVATVLARTTRESPVKQMGEAIGGWFARLPEAIGSLFGRDRD